jgi:gliding motility-associated-like protein
VIYILIENELKCKLASLIKLEKKVLLIIFLIALSVVSYPQVNGFPDSTPIASDENVGFMFQVCYNGKPSFRYPGMINLLASPYIDSYHPPVVSTFAKKIFQNHPLEFTQRDFSSSFAAIDNEVLAAIRIESLPFHGKIKLADVDILAGQVILSADLRKLVFIPDKDYLGTVSFRWVGTDGKEYSVSSANVTITILQQTVFIPGGFSPNGDGINDFFAITGAEKQTITLKVFNRWGVKVYESNHYKNTWDGTSNIGSLNSSQLPEGTYFFVVQYNNGEGEQIGYLTLIR